MPKMPDTRRPKPGLWPPGRPRTTQSHAERTVHEAPATGLPKGWYAWHSFRIRRGGCTETEVDFVIANPSQGILIVEVKGGRIEERDGLWYSNGQLLEQAPREQANRFRHELIELLRSRDILLPPCGIATFFPDTEFGKQRGSGYQPADIAILSLRGGAAPGSVVHLERIGSHRIVRAQNRGWFQRGCRDIPSIQGTGASGDHRHGSSSRP